MSSPEMRDIGGLLSPIVGNNPCGENLRWDSVYDEIKAARREEDKDALGAEGPVQANWPAVIMRDSSTGATAVRARPKPVAMLTNMSDESFTARSAKRPPL